MPAVPKNAGRMSVLEFKYKNTHTHLLMSPSEILLRHITLKLPKWFGNIYSDVSSGFLEQPFNTILSGGNQC